MKKINNFPLSHTIKILATTIFLKNAKKNVVENIKQAEIVLKE